MFGVQKDSSMISVYNKYRTVYRVPCTFSANTSAAFCYVYPIQHAQAHTHTQAYTHILTAHASSMNMQQAAPPPLAHLFDSYSIFITNLRSHVMCLPCATYTYHFPPSTTPPPYLYTYFMPPIQMARDKPILLCRQSHLYAPLAHEIQYKN